jgi:hypothetical protein
MAAHDRASAAVLAAALCLLTVAAPASGQDDVTDPETAGAAMPCAGWGGTTVEPSVGSRIPICVLATLTGADLATGYPDLPVPPPIADPATTIFRTDDPIGDQFLLEDGSVPGGSDPATDIEAIFHSAMDLDRQDARLMQRWLARDAARAGRVVTGQPLRRVIRPGDWNWYYVDTAGDPTTEPDDPRVYQLGYQGPPGRSVPAVIPETNPLDGTQNIVHYRQDPTDDGGVRHSALQTDAGSRRTGADGSVYYNTPPGHVVIVTSDGIQFLVPAKADRLGAFRPMTWDSAAWDFGSTPEGPGAFIPTSGQAPAIFEWWALLLEHEEVPDQTFTLDDQAQSGVPLPSGLWYPSASLLLSQMEQPIPLVAGLDFEGQALVFPDLQIDPVTGVPSGFLFGHGLVGYGLYCLDVFSIPEDAGAWSDATAFSSADGQALAGLGREVRRAVGTSCLRVTEADGLHYWAALLPWLDGYGPMAFDPVLAAQLLEEAGWTTDDGG